MLVVAERINSTRKRIRKAVADRDSDHIASEAKKQAEAGADYIDVNAGTSVKKEVDDLKWLVETVQAAVDKPLCLDSANPKALRAALDLVEKTPIINSTTAETERKEQVVPVAAEGGCSLVALLMDDSGMPESAGDRLEVAGMLIPELEEAGIERERIYVDPLVRPVSTEAAQAKAVLETIRRLNEDFPGVHTICGLSNISFGLPARNVLNTTFLALMMEAGLDSAIMDPTEERMTATVAAARALLDQDDFCMQYIKAHRAGQFVL